MASNNQLNSIPSGSCTALFSALSREVSQVHAWHTQHRWHPSHGLGLGSLHKVVCMKGLAPGLALLTSSPFPFCRVPRLPCRDAPLRLISLSLPCCLSFPFSAFPSPLPCFASAVHVGPLLPGQVKDQTCLWLRHPSVVHVGPLFSVHVQDQPCLWLRHLCQAVCSCSGLSGTGSAHMATST